jgi:AraC-like DNA-binding protein
MGKGMDERTFYLHFSIMAQIFSPSEQTPSPWGRRPWALVDPPGFFRNSARWSWRTRMPEQYFNLWILMEGSVEVQMRGRSIFSERPAYFLLPPGEPVLGTSAGGGEVLNFTLHIARDCLGSFLRGREVEVGWGCEVHNPEELRSWCEAAERYWTRGGALGAELALTLSRAIFLRFWSDVTSPPPDSRLERLHSVAEHMASEPGRNWCIDTVARSQGLSPGRFTQLFRAVHGLPPKAWLSKCRMERARRLLAESDASIQQIAEDLGYADLFFFSRHFKRHVGMSPLAWRRSSLRRIALY